MKNSSGKTIPKNTSVLLHLSVEECIHYTLTVDSDVALIGMSSPKKQDLVFYALRRKNH